MCPFFISGHAGPKRLKGVIIMGLGVCLLVNCGDPPLPQTPPSAHTMDAGTTEQPKEPRVFRVGDLTAFLGKTTPWGCVKNKIDKIGTRQFSACLSDIDACSRKELPRQMDEYMKSELVVLEWTGCEEVQNPWCSMRLLDFECLEIAGTEIGRELCPELDNSSKGEFAPSEKRVYPIAICALSEAECKETTKDYKAPHPSISVVPYIVCMPFGDIKEKYSP